MEVASVGAAEAPVGGEARRLPSPIAPHRFDVETGGITTPAAAAPENGLTEKQNPPLPLVLAVVVATASLQMLRRAASEFPEPSEDRPSEAPLFLNRVTGQPEEAVIPSEPVCWWWLSKPGG